MNLDSKIYVAGHRGMVGTSLLKILKSLNYNNIVTRTSKELDLRNQYDVKTFFKDEKPEYVFLLAAKVGGINANIKYPAEFIYDNLMIQSNVINESYKHNVKKLIFLGSSCIYPHRCSQPMKEQFLMNGPLEPTNEAYAIAKIAGLEMCRFYRKQYGCNFISVMPTNLYGEYDNFDLENSHVIPALIRKIHNAKVETLKEIVVWGTGEIKREFLYVDDLSNALIYLMKTYDNELHINIGTGKDIKIKELVEIIKDTIGYDGNIIYDSTKPDGMAQKLLDVSLINKLGWRYTTSLKDGIKKTYKWWCENGNC